MASIISKKVNRIVLNRHIFKSLPRLSNRLFCNESDKDTTQITIVKEDDKSKSKVSTSLASRLDEERASKAKSKLSDLLKNLDNYTPYEGETAFKLETKPGKKIQDMRKDKMLTKYVGSSMVKAVRDVANALPDEPSKTESELIERLMGLAREVEIKKKQSINEVLEGISIEADPKPARSFNNKQFDKPRSLNKNSPLFSPRTKLGPKVNIYGEEALNIMTKPKFGEEEPDRQELTLEIWHEFAERERKHFLEKPASNAFEEMIRWTEQNKLWRFPINNEEGMIEESQYTFRDHVFLEESLAEGFPKDGPIRHFMELVTTGLSMNPYITVERKHQHIEWYREYFQSKKDLIAEYMEM